MSDWNVRLRTRKEVIEVKEILQIWPEYVAGFPGMEILDKKGRKHILSYLDVTAFREEWDSIQEGSKIEVTLQESIVKAIILPPESPKEIKIEVEGTPSMSANAMRGRPHRTIGPGGEGMPEDAHERTM